MNKTLLEHLEKFGMIVAVLGIAAILEQWTGLLEALQTAPTSIKIGLLLIGLVLAVFAQVQQQKQTIKETTNPEEAK